MIRYYCDFCGGERYSSQGVQNMVYEKTMVPYASSVEKRITLIATITIDIEKSAGDETEYIVCQSCVKKLLREGTLRDVNGVPVVCEVAS